MFLMNVLLKAFLDTMNNTLSIFFFSGLALGWWVMLTLCFSHTFCILEKIWHPPFPYSWLWLYRLKGKNRAVSGNYFWRSILIHLGYPEIFMNNHDYYNDKKIKQYFVKPKLLRLFIIKRVQNNFGSKLFTHIWISDH